MRTIYLGLAIHNHQPVGNFSWVFEQAYNQAYLPMLEALERHPALRFSLHYSGPLLDWIRDNRPDFLARLAALVQRGQVEMMTGGYYEPILASIPEADQLGQIAMMTDVLARGLNARASGLWVAERVWEPHLPRVLAQSGVGWTVLDDTHFKMVGLDDADLLGYYLTEEEGFPLKVFATSKHLRYVIPWRGVDEVIGWLREQATEDGSTIAVMGDDGEKFGMWPGTYEHCWQKGWMEELFSALEQNSDWLITIPLGEYADRFPPLGRVYLPTASYAEMLQWALPAAKSAQLERLTHDLEEQGRADILQFVRGGFWRSFLVKYEEINRMHKKMLRVHRKVWLADGAGRQQLWMGQCNCPYWHGVFGGIYLTDVRAATYQHLIQGEAEAEARLHPEEPRLSWEVTDYDLDGQAELLVEGFAGNYYLAPERGGGLFEWDLRQPPYNLAASLSRRPEAYHQALLEQAGVAASAGGADEGLRSIHDAVRMRSGEALERPVYDDYQRVCLVDHFLPLRTSAQDFATGCYDETGDFVNSKYRYAGEPSGEIMGAAAAGESGGLRIELSRDGGVVFGEAALPVRVRKALALRPGSPDLEVEYTITNLGGQLLEALFASEWNLNLLGGGHNPAAYFQAPGGAEERLDTSSEVESAKEVVLGNRGLGIELRLAVEPAAEIWRLPLETLSNSEGGIEKVYQATCLLAVLPCHLGPGESASFRLRWVLGRSQ
ncbi:MAG: DUF1926 domain-containing protein [Chloroflexi bacterium]|nr:DUF1926 domain-containing protein [Chloroflexota bacterium]MCL5025356.1 DUF1926 domain-containing protein [Chloroflexota bacterium]